MNIAKCSDKYREEVNNALKKAYEETTVMNDTVTLTLKSVNDIMYGMAQDCLKTKDTTHGKGVK